MKEPVKQIQIDSSIHVAGINALVEAKQSLCKSLIGIVKQIHDECGTNLINLNWLGYADDAVVKNAGTITIMEGISMVGYRVQFLCEICLRTIPGNDPTVVRISSGYSGFISNDKEFTSLEFIGDERSLSTEASLKKQIQFLTDMLSVCQFVPVIENRKEE